MLEDRVKIKRNVLSREECAKIIANATNFKYDYLKYDIAPQSKYYDKETLDRNTRELSVVKSFKFRDNTLVRKVSQSPIDEPIFDEWDGHPVYRCKVMKYKTGEYVGEHYDAQWMCLSNYWKPGTNKVSESVMSMVLNDDFMGGEFTVEGVVIPQEVGSVVQIPCNGLDRSKSVKHGVTEVTSGTRYALVFWNFA